jgi:hypothetical protein
MLNLIKKYESSLIQLDITAVIRFNNNRNSGDWRQFHLFHKMAKKLMICEALHKCNLITTIGY